MAKVKPDMGFAASTIGVMLKMLQEQYSDAQIKRMLSARKVNAALAIINEKD